MNVRIAIAVLACWSITAVGQPLLDPDKEADLLQQPPQSRVPVSDTPLIYRSAGSDPATPRNVDEVIHNLREEMRQIAQSTMTAAERQEALNRLYQTHARSFRPSMIGGDEKPPATVEEAAQLFELMFYDLALELSPDQATRNEIVTGAPRHLQLEMPEPILIAPRSTRKKIVVTRKADARYKEEGVTPWWRDARLDAEALELKEIKESPKQQLEPAEENVERRVKVEALADEKTTVEMHDDTTVLRDVEGEDGGLVLFDGVHVWVGGAWQGDRYQFDDLFNANEGGQSTDDFYLRRSEVIVRSTVFDLGEVKMAYDIDDDIWRDLYFRYVNESKGFTLTAGNQKEAISQERLLGNKFTTAMDESAPASAFVTGRGLGLRLNNWFERSADEQFIRYGQAKTRYLTTSLGVFGQDIENSSDTDIAVTGRVTAGSSDTQTGGLHLGMSGSMRKGEFVAIRPRPEMYEAERLYLAEFDSDHTAVLGSELLYSRGSLHAQTEAYLAHYWGGDTDATGFGAYAQVGYILTGQQRTYRPKWGLWAPLSVGAQNVFEVFARISYTYGDAEDDASNDLRVLTLGGNWYRHKIRVSINGVYSQTDREINGEDDGLGVTMRLQYLL
ncbi:MAG: porin [Halieaceae bacterium]